MEEKQSDKHVFPTELSEMDMIEAPNNLKICKVLLSDILVALTHVSDIL